MTARVRSLRAAASFVDRVGLVLVFPKADVVLPSLYEVVAGPGPIQWTTVAEDGTGAFTPEEDRLWRWKDELAAERLSCAGKHVRGWPSLVSGVAVVPTRSRAGPVARMTSAKRTSHPWSWRSPRQCWRTRR